ncbi:MAG: hypothetical protein WC684_02175, partial [Hyphomicrobium sp.]
NENSVHTHLRNTKWGAIGVEEQGEVFWLRIGGRLAASTQNKGCAERNPRPDGTPYDREVLWSRVPLPIADYARCVLAIAETVHCWLTSLSVLDEKRRARVAAYAEKIAATLERAGEALRLLEGVPGDRGAREKAVRELGRISGYIETMVGALEHHLDGRKLTGVKRRLELLRPGELHKTVVAGRKPTHIERLASAEGYFRALADALRM